MDDLLHLPKFCVSEDVSRAATYRYLATGELEAVKLGGKTMIVMESWRRLKANLKPFVSRAATAAKPAPANATTRPGTRRPPGTPRPKKSRRKLAS